MYSENNLTLTGNGTEDFFSFLMINTPVYIFSVGVCSFNVVVVPFIMYSIIWFDKYSSDKKRTFINMINSSICWMAIEHCFTIQATDLIRYLFGPLPKWFCCLQTFVRNAYITQTVLYIDAIALTRYTFIFWLKNPAAFQDGFWLIFLNIWIKGASIIMNSAWLIKAEHFPVDFYICSGIDPTKDFKHPIKIYNVVLLVSVLINLLVYVRIEFYKKKKGNKVGTRSVSVKELFLQEVNFQSITTMTTNLINLAGIGIMVAISTHLSKVKPSEMHLNQNLFHLQYLVIPCFLYLFLISVHFIRHKPLRRTVMNELKGMCIKIKENFCHIR